MISAPPMPCTTRNAMIDPASHDSAHSSDPSTNTANPVSYIRTRPNMSPSRPTWVASSVMTSRKLMMTHTTPDSGTCRLDWISGRASTTMVVSTAAIRTPAMITVMARPGRAETRGPATASSPAGIVLDAAISLA
jgi:hypothetical protein